MKTPLSLPYDKGDIEVEIDSEILRGVLAPGESGMEVEPDQKKIILDALEHPVGSLRLSELAEGKDKIVLITSDHTRAVPSALTLPLLLEEIRKGNPRADITIVVATGLHRGMTPEEMEGKFGASVVENEKIINHYAYDPKLFTNLGVLPSGSKCEINTIAAEADLLVSEGFIEPHFFAGFSGGRKSVLPGIASQDCVNINHSAPAIAHPKAATGVLDGNPVHEDMIRAARLAKLAFIFNVLLDEEKRVIAAYCGDADKAHRAGCKKLLSLCGVDPVPAPIVITSNGGYPLDQNLYQCPKGLDAALACVEEGGVIILVAACADGLGGENFGQMMLEGTPRELMDRIMAIEPEQTISEQWCVQRFADALLKYKIILVTSGLNRELVEKMNFIYADTLESAVNQARSLKGADAGITVIPNGVSVIIRR